MTSLRSNPGAAVRAAFRVAVAFCTLALCVCETNAQSIVGPLQDTGTSQPASTAPDLAPFSSTNPLQILANASSLVTGQNGSDGSSTQVEGTEAKASGFSSAVSVVLLLTVITLAPSILLMTTSFVRMLIVLSLLRQAMGTQSLPPPQVLLALALFMTALVMGPTIDRINTEAVVPYRDGTIQSYDELWVRSSAPVRDFMFDQIEATGNWSSLYMMLNYRGIDTSDPTSMTRADVPTTALIPAFMLSELKTAFLMGFRIYLPFLVIDIVISAILISMGMMMLPPVLISLPFKLLLFVMVDGWQLLVGSLLTSFATDATATYTSAVQPMVHDIGSHVAVTAHAVASHIRDIAIARFV
ncbi:MAG: flagellar type III secretion system pore protein FliP [Phycisphaeraceae bacterium]|nr:flagellar type III secretion system pore protein FliP [Phycisphaerales bacterium]MCB9861675.1 flagellar type III secretion system pore protein FliP [Phycisphaeraceae bacterium]